MERFRVVIREWSEGMRASGRYPEHEPTFNYGHDNDDDDEDRAEIEAEDIESEDENGQYQLKRENSPGQRPKSHHSSPQYQPLTIVSSPRSSWSNTSVPNAPGGALQQGFEANESKEVPEGIPSTSMASTVSQLSRQPITDQKAQVSALSYRGEACQPLDLDLVDLEVKGHFRITKVQSDV